MFAILNSRFKLNRSLSQFFFSLCLLLGLAWTAQAATFQVTTAADNGDDANPVAGSLRAAIINANSSPGTDTIAFAIGSGPQTILPLAALPKVTDPVVIDGTTQPGFAGSPIIEIKGTSAGPVSGLRLYVGNCIAKGLVINSFSNSWGIELGGDGNSVISGNYVGTNLAGTAAAGNFVGIGIFSPNNIIGGTTVADRNIVSGNSSNSGIGLGGGLTSGNVIVGNYIGTDVTGTISIGNNVGIYVIQAAHNNRIGGPTAAERNLISGNHSSGVGLFTNGNTVQGNIIGPYANGATGVSNFYGVEIGGNNNVIGGTAAGEGNVIARNGVNNAGKGVAIRKDFSGNRVLGNSIHSNGGLGLDLADDGVTPNDSGDVDTGVLTANEFQNYPVITSVVPNGNNFDIKGDLNSLPNKQFRLEFFSSPLADPTGFGEGQTFLGAMNVTTDPNGAALNFIFSVPSAAVAGSMITATATDPNNNTSEFAKTFNLNGNDPGVLAWLDVSSQWNESNNKVEVWVKRTGGTNGAVSVNYSTMDGIGNDGAKAPGDYKTTSGTLNFSDGQTNGIISIQLAEDSDPEALEYFYVILSDPTNGATIGGSASAQVFIKDNDQPGISINNLSTTEGDVGSKDVALTVTLSKAHVVPVTVNYATSSVGATATEGVDYQQASGVVTFAPGEVSKPLPTTIKGDPTVEPDEAFYVNLSGASNGQLTKSQGIVTIINDDLPATPTIQFKGASPNMVESLQGVTITVMRTGDTSGSASVDYSTTDGTATQKGDFEYAAGRLSFAPGETEKTFQILLNEDMYVEGLESFSIVLTNVTGATLGAQSTKTVLINDDSPESITNPIDSAQAFVQMQYHDFLNRVPDQNGLTFWTNQILACGADQPCIEAARNNVSAAFFLSIEFQQTGYLVHRLYKASYGDLPNTPVPMTLNEFVPDTRAIGQGVIVTQPGWEQVLESNKQAFVSEFVGRSRFALAYPTTMTPADFVDAMFAKAGVVPTAGQRLAAISEFSGAATSADAGARARALRLVADNPILTQQEFNRAFVLMQYFGYLRRNPHAAPEPGLDYAGYNFWLNKLNQFNGNYLDAEMVKAFTTSIEYRQRFGM